jgi:NTE family protein
MIHATDVARGSRFEFTQDSFDPLCIDLARYPLSRAVAASSSVPALFTPITLRNRGGLCGARGENRHFDYLHLVDGALSDNLGVRGMLDALMDENSPLQQTMTASTPRRVVYITMNAGDSQSAAVGASRQAPATLEMLRLMGTVPVDRYSADSRMLLPAALRAWTARVNAELFYVELELESLRADSQLGSLVALPTTLGLGREEIGGLRCAASHLLQRSSEYRRLLKDLGGEMTAGAGCRDSTHQVIETPLVLR